MTPKVIPQPDGLNSLSALRAMLHERSVIAAFEEFHARLGNVFRLQLPGFHPIVLVGAEANEFILVKEKDNLRWRSDTDPITRLLGNGLLVTDGFVHDDPRRVMTPALHMPMIHAYLNAMWRGTNQTLAKWRDDSTVDLLNEMRKLSLLIVFDALFKDDFSPELERLWGSTLRLMRFISPGLWMIWSGAPERGYSKARRELDEYLYAIIRRRRAQVQSSSEDNDLIGLLISAGYDDHHIRDEMMTMVVAGHDTTTALLAWAWYMLGQHPDVYERARDEATAILGAPSDDLNSDAPPTMDHLKQLTYIDQIVRETLRLYPPAHLGSRIAMQNLEFDGYPIPEGSRVIYSIYLTHRLKAHWGDDANGFRPERFASRPPAKFTYLPFGGGPRLCIGAAFGEIQAKLVMARVLQTFDLQIDPSKAHTHMGATIEPRHGRHGVLARVKRRAF
jgi:cytochrome P450